MIRELIQKIKEQPKLKLLILLLAVWQYISILMMTMFHWPDVFVWLNLGLLLGYILVAPVYESLLLLIISIPFYLALPNTHFDALAMWRVLFLALFAMWFIKEKKYRNLSSILFLPWDKFMGYFIIIGLVITAVFAQFYVQGFKQLFFWLNIYLLYVVLINTLKSKQQIFETIHYTIWSLAIIVTLGFTQLAGTFFTNLDTFWVYWADNISRLYYGAGFASVALYSNSWFSYAGGGRELRMFSIMPDSQSFAFICIFALCMGTALTRSVFRHIKKWLWSGIRFAGLALILSGTRAAWVGMLAPFAAVAAAYYKNFQKHLARKFLWPFVIIFALFALSPVINRGLDFLRVGKFQENFLERAQSIYDLNNVSNQGRLAIWQSSLEFVWHHPLGVGVGNFIVSLGSVPPHASYADVSNEINERYNLPKKFISAHNLYLQILVETGIVGLLAFLAFWVVVLRYLWHFVKNYEKVEDFLVYFVTQALLMALWVLAAAFFDVTLLNDKVLMFFFIDIGLAGLIVRRYHEYEEHV